MKAAIFYEPYKDLTIEEVIIDKPRGREVLVRTAASGVCHSDLHLVDQTMDINLDALKNSPMGAFMKPPLALGHEGAGIVEAVGPDVTYVKPGDHVITCPSVFCRSCEQCLTGHPNRCQNPPRRSAGEPPRLRFKDGTPVNQFADLGTFAEQMLVH